MYEEQNYKKYSIVAGALLLIVLSLMGFRTVEAGEVAVVTKFGAVTGRLLEPGANFITPFVNGTRYINTKLLLYETMKKEDQDHSQSDYKDDPVDTTTKDGQAVDVYYTLRFSIDPTKAQWVIEKFGSEKALVDKIVRAESRSVARTLPANFSAEELYVGTGRDELAKQVYDAMKDKFSENGVILDSFLVRELGFDEQYTQAISAKQIEAVKIETEKNRAEQAKFQKERSITEAEAQAQAQSLQRATLDPQVLEKLALEVKATIAEALKISAEKGQKIVPDTILGEGLNALLNIGGK